MDSVNTRRQARRRLLRTLVAGSGAAVGGRMLPDAWQRPVVESILVPAHAAATGESEYSTIQTSIVSEPGARSLLDLVVPAADAQLNGDGVHLGNAVINLSYVVGPTQAFVCLMANDEFDPFFQESTPLSRTGDELGDETLGKYRLENQRVTPSGVQGSVVELNSSFEEEFTAPPAAFVCFDGLA